MDVKSFGFKTLNLCIDHIGYYERFGVNHIVFCHHP